MILVINSPLFRDKNSLYDEDSLPPIGLGLIATAIKSTGAEVELIDAVAKNIPLADLIEQVNSKKPESICINVFTTNLELVREFIESVNCDAHFVVGGLSTGSLYLEIVRWQTNCPITIVHGDGEKFIIDFLKGELLQNPEYEDGNRKFYRVGNNSPYFVGDISNEKLERHFFVNEPTQHPLGFKEANIVTSRGCVYNCSFCAAARSLNADFAIREKSIESVHDDIDEILRIYPGVESIRVLDDLFLKGKSNVQRATDIFKGKNLQWRSMAHVQTFRDVEQSQVKALRESGCVELFIGIESGSPRILKSINKTSNIDMIKNNISLLLMNGINVKGYFIFGFPGESLEDFEMTYNLAAYLKKVSIDSGTIFRTSVFQFRPYHGTELYHSIEDIVGDSTFSKVAAVNPNPELSDLVGRLQFNFHSGNYSNEHLDVVQKFIYMTTNLNSGRIFPTDGQNSAFSVNKAV